MYRDPTSNVAVQNNICADNEASWDKILGSIIYKGVDIHKQM